MSDVHLPDSWERVPLGELVSVKYGKGLPKDDRTPAGFPYVASAGVIAHTPEALVQDDVLVIGRKGNVGSVQLVHGGAWPSDTTFYVVPSPEIDIRYLALQLTSAGLRQGDQSTAIPGLPREYLETVPVAIAPQAEQTRVVNELERRLAHVDVAERTIERALRRIERACVSVLNAAARGDLLTTCDGESLALRLEAAGVPFEPVQGKDGWVRVRIGTIAKVGSGATPKRGVSKYWHGGNIPWVTSGQLLDSRVTEPAEYITQAALDETSVKLWPAGTLLVAMYGEGRTRGHCAELAFDATCNQACAAINLKPGFEDLQAFLHLVLDARYEENRSLGSGGVQENLNLGLIKGIEVEIPPDQCRDALVAEARRRISLLDAARATITRQLARCAAARSSILTAAFTGHLVPQDPSDDPASVLLERIKEQRETAERSKKPARRPRAKKETTP